MISTDVKYPQVNRTLDLIFEEMKKLKERRISDTDLKIEKKTVRYSTEKVFENNGDFFHRTGIIGMLDFLENAGISMKDYFEGYNKLTQDDIQIAANQYLPSNRKDGSYVLVVGKPGKRLN